MQIPVANHRCFSRFSFVLLFAPGAVHAQSDTLAAGRPDGPAPVATAVPRSGPVTLDGVLDEPAWGAAQPATGFTQQEPDEGAPATERTEVRFLFDDEALYIGARMYDSRGAAGISGRLVRRDEHPQSDLLRIDFDPYHDRVNSVEFDVNPTGWRGDATQYDRSWDPVWEVESRVDSLGWTAEIRIPFGQLRFPRDSVQTWGLNLTRIVHRTQERSMWSFWRRSDPGGPAFFGELRGLEIHRGPGRAEFLPYVVGRAERLRTGDPDSPFHDPNPSDLRIGGDLKYLLTSSFTLSATANPDFGQVEVDPAVVNLSAYETFFPERRPFFVEGRDVFRFGSPGCNINCGQGLNLFYSRRIGRAPQGAGLAYAGGEYADIPESTAILGAAKLTGQTRGGTSVGLMNALTRRETAAVAAADGERFLQAVEPLTNSLVGRATHQLRGGDLVIGGIGTSVNRKLDDPGLAALLPESALTAGVDAEAYWGKRNYRLYAALTASRVAGDSVAIARVQRSSARYFQRPDRSAESGGLFSSAYDPSATELTGYGAIMRLEKRGGDWLWDLNAAAVSPGFETNDLGFQSAADWRWLNGTVGRQFTRPTRAYRSLMAMVGTQRQWNYDGDVTVRDLSAFTRIEFLNYWHASLFVTRRFGSLSDRLTRGGPVVGEAGSLGGFFGLMTDSRRPLVLEVNANGGEDDDGGHSGFVGVSATIRPASNVKLSVGPGYSRRVVTDQYVTSVPDPTATEFSGRRYVFAHLDQRQLFMNTRASVTFTPDVSLEIFAQPLIASADYHDFEEFAAPRQERKLVYGRDTGTITANPDGSRYVVDPDAAGPAQSFTLRDPDFNFRSLRGTGVLRWEWRPGSTAYLVWTQTRSGVAGVGDLAFGRDRDALFAAPADNIFVLKVSYWLGL
jgi:hypothetical protein